MGHDSKAAIVGWNTTQVANIRERYVSDSRVVVAIGKRLAKGAA